jgi:hypothetical protein
MGWRKVRDTRWSASPADRHAKVHEAEFVGQKAQGAATRPPVRGAMKIFTIVQRPALGLAMASLGSLRITRSCFKPS